MTTTKSNAYLLLRKSVFLANKEVQLCKIVKMYLNKVDSHTLSIYITYEAEEKAKYKSYNSRWRKPVKTSKLGEIGDIIYRETDNTSRAN